MSRRYSKIIQNPDNLELIADAIEYFEKEYLDARKELDVKGRVEEISRNIPGIVEYRFGQLQELEAIMCFLERKEAKTKAEKKRHFLEHYNRDISERLADQYANVEDDVMVIKEVLEHVSLVRNKFLSITKGLEYLHFQIGNIIKLRVAGMEDATL